MEYDDTIGEALNIRALEILASEGQAALTDFLQSLTAEERRGMLKHTILRALPEDEREEILTRLRRKQ